VLAFQSKYDFLKEENTVVYTMSSEGLTINVKIKKVNNDITNHFEFSKIQDSAYLK